MERRLNLFFNGNILQPHLSAEIPEPRALLASAGRILALEAEATPFRGAGVTEIDLQGGVAIPGPVDAHCHLVSYGLTQLREVDLRGARSLPELRERLLKHAAERNIRSGNDRWLLGHAFDQELLAEQRWPTRQDLDAIAPDVPVLIERVCGHAVVTNTLALQAAGYEPGYRKGDLPEGVLTEEAIGPLYRAIPKPTPEEWRMAAAWATQEAARVGFVGVHSLMAHAREVRALIEVHRETPLPVRVTMLPPYSMLDALTGAGLCDRFGDETLSFGGIKLFSDGSMGARSAALREDYADDPGNRGELIYPPAELTERIRRIYAAGWPVCVHAIGDRAMEVTVEALEAAAQSVFGTEGRPPKPPRIEHGSFTPPDLLPRIRALGAGIAIQPQFARSDYWTLARVGPDRLPHCYSFRTLWEAGVPLALSTDCPVEKLDALAVLGQLVSPPEYLGDEQHTKAVPLQPALRLFSEGSYSLQGYPAGKGTLSVGQFADFIVLNKDPRTVPPEEIEHLRVIMTVVGGQVVFAA